MEFEAYVIERFDGEKFHLQKSHNIPLMLNSEKVAIEAERITRHVGDKPGRIFKVYVTMEVE
jgi:hypothetical protein